MSPSIRSMVDNSRYIISKILYVYIVLPELTSCTLWCSIFSFLFSVLYIIILLFVPFSLCHCIICPSVIYGFIFFSQDFQDFIRKRSDTIYVTWGQHLKQILHKWRNEQITDITHSIYNTSQIQYMITNYNTWLPQDNIFKTFLQQVKNHAMYLSNWIKKGYQAVLSICI